MTKRNPCFSRTLVGPASDVALNAGKILSTLCYGCAALSHSHIHLFRLRRVFYPMSPYPIVFIVALTLSAAALTTHPADSDNFIFAHHDGPVHVTSQIAHKRCNYHTADNSVVTAFSIASSSGKTPEVQPTPKSTTVTTARAPSNKPSFMSGTQTGQGAHPLKNLLCAK